MTERPVLLMIAGPNGSGKTTLTHQLRADGVDLGEYINPDEIAETLAGDDPTRVAQAQRLAEERRQACFKRHVSFSFETVMSHPSKIEILKQARTLGYFNVLYFVATESPYLNVARVRQRVALGGHAVPEDRIVARYHRTLALLRAAIAQCDRTVLFDNSYRGGRDDPVRLEPFCEIVWGGKGEPVVVLLADDRVPSWVRGLLPAL